MSGAERLREAAVITLCGSTKFKAEFMAENQRLTMDGFVVISLGVFGHTDLPDYDWTTDASDLKRRLDGLHFQKIRMADRVHVVDPGGYVGESTRREVAYAESLGKPVTYLSRGGGRVAEESEPDRVSSAPSGDAESRERLDPLAATSSWRAETLGDLVNSAARIVAQTDTCNCPDEPHQNGLHDLAHDLVRLSASLDLRRAS